MVKSWGGSRRGRLQPPTRSDDLALAAFFVEPVELQAGRQLLLEIEASALKDRAGRQVPSYYVSLNKHPSVC